MKKLISLLLIALLAFSLCACGQVDIPENPNADSPAEYLSDPDVMIIAEKQDIDEKAIKEHYSENKIILVKNWELASEVQNFIATTITTEFSNEDHAIIFYRNTDGVPGVSVINGNITDLEGEIDEMIETARTHQ